MTPFTVVGNDIINGNDGADTLFGRMVTTRSLAVLEQTASMLKPVVIPLPAGPVTTLYLSDAQYHTIQMQRDLIVP